LDLPLKISVFQDETGSSFLAFRKLSYLAESHGKSGDPRFAKMEALLEKLASQAADL
jgi:uncharacterized protein (DUF302 family)